MNTGTGGGLYSESSGHNTAMFVNRATGNNFALVAHSYGTYPTAQFENRVVGGGVALRAFGNSDVINGNFTVSSGSITVNGGNLTVYGNSMVSGSKNAIVPTSSGVRKVYSEESSEVWFTEYGEARLANGVVTVHDASFSYRLVAKRKGFAHERLERVQ